MIKIQDYYPLKICIRLVSPILSEIRAAIQIDNYMIIIDFYVYMIYNFYE